MDSAIDVFCNNFDKKKSELNVLTCHSGYMDENRPPYFFGDNTKARMDECARLMKTGDYDVVIVSGGRVFPRGNIAQSDAVLMKDYLVREAGIDENKIFMDEEAVDAYENVDNTISIIDCLKSRLGIEKVNLVMSGTWGQGRRNQLIFADRGVAAQLKFVPHQKSFSEWAAGLLVVFFTFFDVKGDGIMAQLVKWHRRRLVK